MYVLSIGIVNPSKVGDLNDEITFQATSPSLDYLIKLFPSLESSQNFLICHDVLSIFVRKRETSSILSPK